MRICFIVAPQNRNGILDRIAHEIGRQFDEAIYHYDTRDLPNADHYFVTHYTMLNMIMIQVNPSITPVTCFFTHDKGSIGHFTDSMNLCGAVIAESLEGLELLKSYGVSEKLLHYVPEGGDNLAFRPHERTEDGALLICSTNYADGRKNPELVQAVIDKIGLERKIFVVGKDWNLRGATAYYDTIGYESYPDIYAKCSVFLSCAKLEGGGPNSLIEAMHANLVPVVSDTGNARDYIKHGFNGFIFGKGATAQEVVGLINRAFVFKPQDRLPCEDVWRTVQHYTWKNYGTQMREIITGDYSTTTAQGDYAMKPETA